MPVVEQEQRRGQVGGELQVACDGAIERSTKIRHVVVDRAGRFGFVYARNLLAQMSGARRIDLAMAGFHGLEQA